MPRITGVKIPCSLAVAHTIDVLGSRFVENICSADNTSVFTVVVVGVVVLVVVAMMTVMVVAAL